MKYVVIFVSALLAWSPNAGAQQDAANVEGPSGANSNGDDRSPYYKKVRGWLWLEGVTGISSYNPDKFGTLFGSVPDAPRSRGPQYGFALGTGFGGGFFLGWYWRQANHDGYKLMRTGVELQPTIRIPFVHIAFRVDIGLARIRDGNPWGLDAFDSGGLDTTFGVGLRIPIVRWISFAATVDWSYVGLSVRATDPTSGNREKQWVSGQQLAGTFALTFHFIGVRKN